MVTSAPAKQKERSYRAPLRLSSEQGWRRPPGRDQGKNKSGTNRRPRHANSDSQTKRVEFLSSPGAKPSGASRRLGAVPFRPAAPADKASANQGVAKSPAIIRAEPLCRRRPLASSHGRQSLARSSTPLPRSGTGRKRPGTKGGRNQRRGEKREPPPERQSQFATPGRRNGAMVAKAFPGSRPPCPDPGRGRRKRAQSEPESATRRKARAAARKAIAIRDPWAPQWRHGRQSVPRVSPALP